LKVFIPQVWSYCRGLYRVNDVGITALVAMLVVTVAPALVLAGPVIAPGDMALRHDIQRLVHAGLISGTVSSSRLAEAIGRQLPCTLAT
jgi:preprotein translocase subunit SecF